MIKTVLRDRVEGFEVQDFDNNFFAVEPSFFEICKMNKIGVICMSVAFHSRI